VRGAFTALAQTGITGANGAVFSTGARVALTISSAVTHEPVFHVANAGAAGGAAVPALPAGVYDARWVVSDRNGDTRTVHTKFVSQG
jgi:hypothetical protein